VYVITWKPRSAPVASAVIVVEIGCDSVGKTVTTAVGVPDTVVVANSLMLFGETPKTIFAPLLVSAVNFIPTSPIAVLSPH